MGLCIVTGVETADKLNSVPLSREARPLLNEIVAKHNDKIFEYFKEKNRESNNGTDLDDATLRNFAPTISKKNVIQLLIDGEKDILETRYEVLGEA